MNNQTSLPKDHMVLLYRKVGRRLYGYIAFYRREHSDQEIADKPYRESSPFVIGRYSADQSGALEVLGSVVFLLEEIRRCIKNFVDENNSWNAERGQLTSEVEIAESDLRYEQSAMDFVILVATHARNLFDMMARFNDRSIPRLDYQGARDGEVTLRELFDTLIHNRYYFFDGAYVRDLFSDDFKKKKSALSGRFMGYGFDIVDFVNGISEVIEEVIVKDAVQLLWGKFKEFTADSKPQDIVSLIQNVRAFSDLLQAKIPTAGYQFMCSLMFDELANTVERTGSVTKPGGTAVMTQKVIFASPNIGIASELNKKEFEIRVRCAMGKPNRDPVKEDMKDHTVRIGFEEFFRKVNEAFGDDRVLTGMPWRIESANAEGDE